MYYRNCFQHLGQIERKRIFTASNVHLRLNRGERPTPLPGEILERIAALDLSNVQQYPSYQEFYEKLSAFIGFPTEQIVVGAGIEEFIRTLMFLCCDPGQKAVVLWPTCAMYDIYAAAFGVKLVRVTPSVGVDFSIEDFIDAIPDEARVVFVPNPGQPVETYFDVGQLRVLARHCAARGQVLAIDEAHFGFGAFTALPLIAAFDNILVMRTFSKFFGAASIRVGFVVGSPKLIKPLHAVRPSGEIAGPSLAIASVLLDSIELLEAEAVRTAAGRDWLRDIVADTLRLRTWGAKGFSVLIEFESAEQVLAVTAELAKAGAYVKAGFPSPVERCMLVACGNKDLMQTFFALLSVCALWSLRPGLSSTAKNRRLMSCLKRWQSRLRSRS